MTTLIAPLSRADQVVTAIRSEHDWSARRGVPAHLTLFGPFVSPGEVTPDLLDRLRGLFEREAAPRISLNQLHRLGDAACLLPEETQPLTALTDRLGRLRRDRHQRAQHHHVTVARQCDDALFVRLSAELKPHLPLIDCPAVAELLEAAATGQSDHSPNSRFSATPRHARIHSLNPRVARARLATGGGLSTSRFDSDLGGRHNCGHDDASRCGQSAITSLNLSIVSSASTSAS
jgi:2'-5' RNA ligase